MSPGGASPHLGDQVTALADGQLPPAATERALAHVAGCEQCRALLDAERAAKSWVSGLASPSPAPQLTARLLDLAGPVPLLPREDAGPGSRGPRPVAVPSRGPSRSARRPGSRTSTRRRRLAVAVVGVASLVGTGMGVGALLSAVPAPAPVAPPVDAFLLEHAGTTADMPFADPQLRWLPVSVGAGR